MWFLLSACLGSVTRTATTQAIPKEKRMKVICNVSDLEMQQSIELYESRHAAMVMSALHPKADMCSAPYNVRYGPKADIRCRQQIFKNRPT